MSCFLELNLNSVLSPKEALLSIQFMTWPSKMTGWSRRQSGVLVVSSPRRSFSVLYVIPWPSSHSWSRFSPQIPLSR